TEIVIHVNMLKEGWDVTNLYTIVPLRAANARTLIEQSIGRGLRLPYGKRTGVATVDRLSIVAHDRFQEIIDEASRPDSVIRLQQVILDPEKDFQKTVTVVAQSNLAMQLGGHAPQASSGNAVPAALFTSDGERRIAEVAYQVMRKYEVLPNSAHLLTEEIQRKIVQEVSEVVTPAQLDLAGMSGKVDVAAIVRKTANAVVEQTIDIPRIVVIPRGDVTIGYHSFRLDLSGIGYQPVDRDLLIQHLRTREQETLSFGTRGQHEIRLEDYVVRGLMDFDEISYDDHAELLYDLAGQLVSRLRGYLAEEEVRNVLIYHQKQIAAFIRAQMQAHQWETVVDYDVVVKKGFTELKGSAYTATAGEVVHNFQQAVEDKSRIPQMLFGGFERCLFWPTKFQSDSERKLAVILDRESLKWLRPAKGQFRIFYKSGTDDPEYVPDFVAETVDRIYMLESKARNELNDADVLAKQAAAEKWCGLATEHTARNGGRPWQYVLIPHDVIAENMTLEALANRYG
ncbi:MAG: type III restriction endonuclease subunit R, partial [Betaproteobacteria bacterium]